MKTLVAVISAALVGPLPVDQGGVTSTSVASTASAQTTAYNAAEFKPTDLSGLKLWLDAAQGTTVTGLGVSAWADQSGAGNNASEGTDADRPAFNATGWSNGLPTVDFDRANTESMGITVASGSTSNDYTCFAVIDQRTPTTNIQMLLSTFGGSADFGPMTPVNPSNDVGILNGAVWKGAAAGDAASGEQYLTWEIDGTNSLLTTYRNGVSLGTDTFTPTNMRYGSTTRVGSYRGGSTTHNFNGEVASMFLYERVLTAQELTVVHIYLDSHY